MITLRTITTIELSNTCQLQCPYCINRLLAKHPSRKPGIMSDKVFKAILDLLGRLVENGTQQVVNLNGNGESCLDPKLPERVAAVKSIVNGRRVQLCTNGLNMTPELALQLAEAGIDQVDVSIHRPEVTRKAIEYLSACGIMGVISAGAVGMSHNWAGQLEPENSVDHVESQPCYPLEGGWGYVQAEGNISPCCYDYRNLGTFGTVFDPDILEKEIKPYELCESCHQEIRFERLGRK